MKINVGETVRNYVNKASKTKTQIAKDIPLSRTQLYDILAEDHMELEYIIKIGKSIRHDFTADLPEISKYLVEEPQAYEVLDAQQLRIELLDLQRRYISLQETHIKTLNELRGFERAK